MSTNTKNLKLIKQEEHEYYNLNVINENLDKIDSAIEDNLTSPDLLNEDITQFIVGTGTVEGINKDYTEDMCQSVVTLDNIKGKTVKNGTFMNSIELNNIYRVINENTTVNLLRGNPTPLVFAYDHQSSGCYLYDAIHDYNSSQRVAYLDLVDVKPNTTYCIKNFTNNLSLNMVGHMYDENYCKSDEDKGWGENTDTRFLTTNSTTKKMCVYIRKQDDTELTQNEIDSLKIMVVEGNTEPMTYIKSDYKSELYEFDDITLRSVSNEIYDELNKGTLTRKVGYLSYEELYDLDWKLFSQSSSNMQGFKVALDTLIPNTNNNPSIVSGIATTFKSHDAWYSSSDGGTISVNWGSIYLKLTKANYPTVNDAKEWIKNNKISLQFVCLPYEKEVNVSLVVNSGETININTPVPLTCTHKVSLNTKSQIEELQEVVYREKKSILQKVKDLLSVKYSFDTISYFVFPSLFGSLKVQWGHIHISGGTPSGEFTVTFPISFNKKYSLQLTTEGTNAYEVDVTKLNGVFNRSNNGFNFSLSKTNDGVGVSVLWFAFGV